MNKVRIFTFTSALFSFGLTAFATSLEVIPGTFDFGWCPKNVKVSCEFLVKNQTPNMIPITAVRPSCGCTATDFTPGDLSSMDEMNVGLTFNTRGYEGRAFRKKSTIEIGAADESRVVYLKGHVLDPNALVLPKGTGIADYRPKTKKSKQVVSIYNKTSQEVTLDVVQDPAVWAKYKLSKTKIPAGGTVDLTVTVEPPYDKIKNTSITLEGIERTNTHRFTVAIQTGPPQKSFRKLKEPSSSGPEPPTKKWTY